MSSRKSSSRPSSARSSASAAAHGDHTPRSRKKAEELLLDCKAAFLMVFDDLDREIKSEKQLSLGKKYM